MIVLNDVVSEQKCIDYTEKLPFMVTFLYNLYIFAVVPKQKCIDYIENDNLWSFFSIIYTFF